MIDELLGRRCTSIRRFQHRLAGHPPSETGPVEFLWDDGTYLSLDANTDWTLNLSSSPWADPLESLAEGRRQALAQEVGLWEEAAIPNNLTQLIGQAVISADPELNEVGELTGLRLGFEAEVVAARVLSGKLAIEVLE